jgi:hypothetical protein
MHDAGTPPANRRGIAGGAGVKIENRSQKTEVWSQNKKFNF